MTRLGEHGPDVSRVGLGCMGMSGMNGGWLGYDARPAAVKTARAYSLQRLRVDHIDVYRPARLDQQVPIEQTIGAIAWVLSRAEDIVPLIGARTRERLTEARGALDLTLSDRDIEEIEQAMPAEAAVGDRYPAAQMGQLDSER
jgi:aryl-alcohol dehydrogenase-like predicted oxidoreductase